VHRLALLAALAVLLAGTAARDGGGLGPALDPNRLSQLPREGLAAELDHRLVLVSARGRVLGHLDDFTLAEEPALDQIAPGPRPLELRDRFAVRSELREGRLVPTRARLRLARGAVLGLKAGRWTLRGSRVGFVSEHRDLVTFFGRRSARVLDLRSGRSTAVPAGCRAAARSGARWFLLCGFPYGKGPSTVRTRSGALLVGPAERRGARPAGSWAGAFLSPDGEWLLLQWSGECETPTAFFAPAAGGSVTTVTGQPGLRNAPESIGLGWARDGRAIVDLPQGVCGAGSSKPGIYLVDPGGGKRTYVYRRSRFWRAFS